MTVGVQRGLDALMAETFLQQLRRDIHLDQSCRMTVPEVVCPGLLDAGLLAAADHLPIQEGLAVGEQTIIRTELIALRHIVPEAVAEDLWDRDRAVGLRRLGRSNEVLSVQLLVAFVDAVRSGLPKRNMVLATSSQRWYTPTSRTQLRRRNSDILSITVTCMLWPCRWWRWS